MDILGQSSLLVAITSFGLGFSVLARNVRNKLFLAFAVLCTLISAWSLFFFLYAMGGAATFYRLHLFFNVWLAPAGLTFIRLLVRGHDKPSRRLLDFSLITAACLTVALGFYWESLEWVKQLIYFCPGFIVAQTLLLMWIDRRLRRGLKLIPKVPTVGFARRNLIYAGALFVLSTSVMDHVPWVGNAVPVIGNLALTVYLFFIAQAISQQRLLNFGALFSRFLVLLMMALLLTGVYSLLFAWIQSSFPLFLLNSFIISFLIVMLLEPLRSVVRYLTQRLLTQKHLRLEQLLREAQRKLAGIVDASSLFQAILVLVEQTLQPEWAALYVLRVDGTRFRRVRETGPHPAAAEPGWEEPLREILSSHILLAHCQRLHRRGDIPVLLDQILEAEIERSASRVQRESLAALLQGLKALRCNLLVPLFDSGKVLGFVTLYAPKPPEPWGNNWGLLQIIYPFFEQAAQTARNLEVYARQREKERLAALGEMSAGLAHEIRNPLGAIKGAAQLLDPSPGKPESGFVRVIVEEVDRLNRVVTQFLEYSKPRPLELKRVDASVIAGKTIDLVQSTRPQGLKLVFDAAAAPAWIAAAPEQLQQVILNLVQNSIKAIETKATSSGTVRVRVELEGEEPLREVVVSVEDDGVGIKKENLDKLFIPFFTTSPSGTGLGLSICQKIVEAHHGRIEVLSEERVFTRFSVVLPYASEPASG